jgi:hypothetical protein
MRIENIISDIIQDTLEIKNMVEARIRKEDPDLSFSLELPELNSLSSIKLIELNIHHGEDLYTLSAEIHTLNGYRVFERASRRNPGSPVPHDPKGAQLQRWYIELLRETIRKRKKYQSGYHPRKNQLGDALKVN